MARRDYMGYHFSHTINTNFYEIVLFWILSYFYDIQRKRWTETAADKSSHVHGKLEDSHIINNEHLNYEKCY